MKKRWTAFIMAFAMGIASIGGMSAFADEQAEEKPITVKVNGLDLRMNQEPVMVDDRVLVPMRVIFEGLSAEVDWDDDTSTATGTLDRNTVSITVGSNTGYVNGEPIELDVGAQLINDRTMVPIRFVSEGLKAEVNWDDENKTVAIDKTYGKTGDIDNLIPEGGKRPVPTQFEKSSDPNDFLYYDFPEDPDVAFNKLGEGKVIMTFEDFAHTSKRLGVPEYGFLDYNYLNEDGERVLRFNQQVVPTTTWEYSVNYDVPEDAVFNEGDWTVIKLTAKLVSGGNFDNGYGNLQFGFGTKTSSKAANSGIGSVDASIAPDKYKNYYFCTRLNPEYQSYTFRVNLHPVSNKQIIDIKDIQVINFGPDHEANDMPSAISAYKGADPDAQWRKDAVERIEQIRKGDINIVVKDKDGNLIPNADVNLDMYEHEFLFSNAAGYPSTFREDHGYAQMVVQNFNSMGREGAHHENRGTENYDKEDSLIEWAARQGIGKEWRGHAMMWDSEVSQKDIDGWFGHYYDVLGDYDKLQEQVKERIRFIANRFPNVTEWDVSNEDSSREGGPNNTFKNIYGRKILIDWYKTAREAVAPGVRLALTDGFCKSTTSFYGQGLPFLEWAVENLDFDVIGNQGHISYTSTPEDQIRMNEDMSKLGKRISVTEFDCNGIKGAGDEVQKYRANIVRDMMIAHFSCENVDQITLWGFWDSTSANLSARIMYNFDMSIRLAGLEYQDLVYNKWWTREKGKTSSDGSFSTRGFYGDYTVKVKANGQTKKVDVSLRKADDRTVTVVMD